MPSPAVPSKADTAIKLRVWALLNDSGAKESGAKESGAKESGAKESGAKESGAKESGANESGAKESGAKESGAKESGAKESGANESGAKESGANESGLKASAANESGANESGAKRVWGEFSPQPCQILCRIQAIEGLSDIFIQGQVVVCRQIGQSDNHPAAWGDLKLEPARLAGFINIAVNRFFIQCLDQKSGAMRSPRSCCSALPRRIARILKCSRLGR